MIKIIFGDIYVNADNSSLFLYEINIYSAWLFIVVVFHLDLGVFFYWKGGRLEEVVVCLGVLLLNVVWFVFCLCVFTFVVVFVVRGGGVLWGFFCLFWGYFFNALKNVLVIRLATKWQLMAEGVYWSYNGIKTTGCMLSVLRFTTVTLWDI